MGIVWRDIAFQDAACAGQWSIFLGDVVLRTMGTPAILPLVFTESGWRIGVNPGVELGVAASLMQGF